MIEQALLLWLVAYLGLLAMTGFFLVVMRGFTGRPWSNTWILRLSSGTAFVLAAAFWTLILFLG